MNYIIIFISIFIVVPLILLSFWKSKNKAKASKIILLRGLTFMLVPILIILILPDKIGNLAFIAMWIFIILAFGYYVCKAASNIPMDDSEKK